MTYKQLRLGSEGREKVLRGESALADAVRVTLGPKSKPVLILEPARPEVGGAPMPEL
jgi:chaperonin GroEL